MVDLGCGQLGEERRGFGLGGYLYTIMDEYLPGRKWLIWVAANLVRKGMALGQEGTCTQ